LIDMKATALFEEMVHVPRNVVHEENGARA
jgi:hypothetical protein